MTAPCGCCEGVERVTPIPIANRPGLPALAYRVGTHATFLETMLARLPSMHVGALRPLRGLTARTPDDPAIALLDAWATVADVLAFYQERIANEGYLRTATERRSILELARLVGYRLRPGVASSVYLAYTLEPGSEVEIPAGSRVQSLPGPGELPQPFETAEPLHARAEWNNLQVRLHRPQTQHSIQEGMRVYLRGVATNLRRNDPLLMDFGGGSPELYRVTDVEPDAASDRTLVKLQHWQPAANRQAIRSDTVPRSHQLLDRLLTAPSLPPASGARLVRDVGRSFGDKAAARVDLLGSLRPAVSEALPIVLANRKATPDSEIKVYALRLKAAPFGSNAPKRTGVNPRSGEVTVIGEWPIVEWKLTDSETVAKESVLHEQPCVLDLDGNYDQITGGTATAPSWIVIDASAWTGQHDKAQVRPANSLLIARIEKPQSNIARADYGITGRTTRLTLDQAWLAITQVTTPKPQDLQAIYDADFAVIRNSAIYTQSEELALADEPLTGCVGADAMFPETPSRVELADLYEGLHSGRWIIVSGERADIDVNGESVGGVHASELAMIAEVTQDIHKIVTGENGAQELSGDRTHSFVELSTPLAYCYKRDTVTIYGNVVKATHGETREEILGSGDGSKGLQEFALRQSPLTYLPSSTPPGAASTLELRVNGVEWHEADSLAGVGRTDRKFITKTDDRHKTTVIFGNGEHGARLPTGVENVKAVYRTGIGKAGNVKAGQISLLATRPLGVKGVINPQRASGGADPDTRDQARRNTPLAVMALDRLVSVQDYADFARSFADVGKATAARLTDGHRQLVHVTIAGVDDAAIDEASELYRNLRRALHEHGDPYQPIELAIRELLLLVISANVRVMPDYEWESVAPRLRAILLDTFSFERRELGQDVFLSEVVSAMQAVEGVNYVDVDTLTLVDEETVKALLVGNGKVDFGLPENGRLRVEVARVDDKVPGVIRPAQIALLTPDVPDTLILNLVE
jgi:hypothetical protein